MFHLIARGRGWRWPLVTLEVWTATQQIADVPAELVLSILLHHLQGLALSDEVRERLTAALPPPAVQPRLRLRGLTGRRLRSRP